jgi:fatty acid desaturase
LVVDVVVAPRRIRTLLVAGIIGASLGVWLFYVQHQFEHTFWARGKAWNLHEAALFGSSHYDLPSVLRWFTANIGLHHIHHLCSRIPFYRLPLAFRLHPDLADVGRLTLGQSFACVRRVLWDEASERLITFRELRNQLKRVDQFMRLREAIEEQASRKFFEESVWVDRPVILQSNDFSIVASLRRPDHN